MAPFDPKAYLPAKLLARITDIRIADPQCARRMALERPRRQVLTRNGRLALLAADHPARGVNAVGDNPLAMADRHAFLGRVARVLAGGAVDGIMATMDTIEDLLILDQLLGEVGAPTLLDGKLLLPSLNRGGIAGTAWELDDPLTGPTPESCRAWRMDGVKVLLRLADEERDSLKTLIACADIVSRCNALDMPVFLEPLAVRRDASGWAVVKDAAALTRLVGIASALGDSSRMLWLKLPYCDGFAQVAGATTLPIVLLGGPAVGDATPLLLQVEAGLAAGTNVRGTLVGRNVLYPGDSDPLAVARAIYALVHEGADLETALRAGIEAAKATPPRMVEAE